MPGLPSGHQLDEAALTDGCMPEPQRGMSGPQRFYWPAAKRPAVNDGKWPKLLVQNGAGKLPVEVGGNEGYVGRCSDGRLYVCLTSADQR